jgi:hypothetical protein
MTNILNNTKGKDVQLHITKAYKIIDYICLLIMSNKYLENSKILHNKIHNQKCKEKAYHKDRCY